jgi:multiple sugar transport system permease protein
MLAQTLSFVRRRIDRALSIPVGNMAKNDSRGFYVIAAVIVFISFFPTGWLVLTSLKSTAEIYAWPIVFFPKPVTFENYNYILNETPEFIRYLWNSFVVASITTLSILSFGGLAAYAISRLNFTGHNIIMIGMLAVSMFPPMALLPSLFDIFLELNLINTYPSLIIAHTGLYMPMAIWILASYYRTIPFEIEDAARVDGSSSFRIFWNIILPLSVPGLIATGLIVFIFSWNEFPLALVLLSDNTMRTAPVGISLYPGEFSFPWEIISAATVLAILPVLIISGIFSNRIVGGLTAGSVK